MFCPKCGTEINDCKEEDEIKSLKNENFKNPFKKFFYLLKEIILKPSTGCKEVIYNLSGKETITYFSILSLVTAFISAITLRRSIINLAKTIISFFVSIGSEILTKADLLDINKNIDMTLSKNIKALNIFSIELLSILIFYLLLTLLMYLIFTVIIKKKISFINYLKVSTCGIYIHCFFTLIGGVLLPLSVILSTVILIFSNLIIVFVLFNGFKNLIKSTNKIIYIYPVLFIIINLLQCYITLILLTSYILNKNII